MKFRYCPKSIFTCVLAFINAQPVLENAFVSITWGRFNVCNVFVGFEDIGEAKTPVLALCNFIVNQCSRPKQAHSRDLHSSIVAAFRCLQMWLLHYPALLTADPRGTLYPILETIELGLSGCKSIVSSMSFRISFGKAKGGCRIFCWM